LVGVLVVHAYVRTRLARSHPTLSDFLSNAAPEEDDTATQDVAKGPAYWDEYLSSDELKLGLHKGELKQGRLFASRQNLNEAMIALDVCESERASERARVPYTA
jgi:hypothetical protein